MIRVYRANKDIIYFDTENYLETLFTFNLFEKR